MFFPTPTPDAFAFLQAATVTWGLSGSTIASRFHMRWGQRLGWGFEHTYALVLTTTLMLGVALIPAEQVVGVEAGIGLLLAPLAGLGIGWLGFRADLWVSRALFRRKARRERRSAAGGARQRHYRGRASAAIQTVGLNGKARPSPAPQESAPAAQTLPTLGPLLLVAALEELVFRGVLHQMALSLAGLAPVALVLLALIFALNHIHFGWEQVPAKIPFSFLCLAGVVATGTVIAAISGHLLFNFLVYRTIKQRSGEGKSALAGDEA